MKTSKMCRCVIIGPVCSLVSARLAFGEEFLVGGDIDTDPDFAGFLVSSINMSSQFVLAAEALFVGVAV